MTSSDEARQRQGATGRNDPCPCGSGKKYKKCHSAEDAAAVHAELKEREEAANAALAAEKANEDEKSKEPGEKEKSRHRPDRPASQASNKDQNHNVQPKNMPRRGAV